MKETHTQEIIALKPFDIQKAKLQEIAKDCDIVVTDETFEEAKKNRKTIRDERFAIQNILKENKAIINTLKSDQEKKADELIALLTPTEEKLDSGIKAIEDRKEIEKARKEKEAADKIATRTASLFENGMTFNGEGYILGASVITPVQIKVLSDSEFNELLVDIKDAHAKVLEQKKADAELLAKAQEEQKQRAEKERLALEKENAEKAEAQRVENARLKAENDKLDQERKAFAEEKRILQEENDRKRKEIADKEAEIKAIEDKKIADKEAAENKKAQAKRAEALKPDKEKLELLSNTLNGIEMPELTDEKAKLVAKEVNVMLDGIIEFISLSIKKL
jgi:hypothetical protein